MASFSSILLFIQFSPLFAFYMIRPLELEDILAMQAQQEMEEDERELASRWRTLRQALLRSEDPLGKLEMDMMDGEEDGERPHNALTVLMVPDDDEDDGNMLFEDDDGPKLILNDGNEDGEEEDWIWVERPKEDENNNKKMFILQ